MSAIGVGTWQFGSAEVGLRPRVRREGAVPIVQRALDLGVNLVDTAEIYAMGESERIVGRAIAERRDEVFVATKVFPILPLSPIVQWRGVQSANRLGVDHIDLYQVHWPNPVVPVPATMRGMRALLDCGLVRNVGVSNFSADRWRWPRTASVRRCCRTRSSTALRVASRTPGQRAVRPGAGSDRHRVQPAREGSARWPLRRRSPAERDGPHGQPALPAREPGTGGRSHARPCVRWRPPTTRRPPRLRWRG